MSLLRSWNGLELEAALNTSNTLYQKQKLNKVRTNKKFDATSLAFGVATLSEASSFLRYSSPSCTYPFVQKSKLYSLSLLYSFIYVIPAIAQRMVKDAQLPISYVRIMQPTPGSVVLSLNASLKIPPPFTIRLEPLTLQLYRPETKPNIKPYINYHLPEQHLKGNATISVVNQTVEIIDVEEFTEMLKNAVYDEKFIMAARGEATAHIGALKAKVTLDKEIELSGKSRMTFDVRKAS